MKSWRNLSVRIKPRLITTMKEINESLSTYDIDGNVINAVYDEYEFIQSNAYGINNVIQDPRQVFKVTMDVFGVDLLRAESLTDRELFEPEHLIMLDNSTYLWDSFDFEVVKAEQVWVRNDEFMSKL